MEEVSGLSVKTPLENGRQQRNPLPHASLLALLFERILHRGGGSPKELRRTSILVRHGAVSVGFRSALLAAVVFKLRVDEEP